jgi:hypothetical protein
MTISIETFLERYGKLRLVEGNTDDPATGACAMAAAAWLAGEAHSDAPKCVPEDLHDVVISINDYIDGDDRRTRLIAPIIPRLMGADPSLAAVDTRLRVLVSDVVRLVLPMAIESIFPRVAQALRNFEFISSSTPPQHCLTALLRLTDIMAMLHPVKTSHEHRDDVFTRHITELDIAAHNRLANISFKLSSEGSSYPLGRFSLENLGPDDIANVDDTETIRNYGVNLINITMRDLDVVAGNPRQAVEEALVSMLGRMCDVGDRKEPGEIAAKFCSDLVANCQP